jgi:hypothetical protein
MPYLPAIPKQASALITIFRGHHGCDEPMATIAIDSHTFTATPIGESVRIDINSLDGLPVSLSALLHLLGMLKPLFPGVMHFVGIFEDSQEGRIVFLPEPRNTDRPNWNLAHEPIIPHERDVANSR